MHACCNCLWFCVVRDLTITFDTQQLVTPTFLLNTAMADDDAPPPQPPGEQPRLTAVAALLVIRSKNLVRSG